MLVKHKVACPHEAILGDMNKTRLVYDQLSITQCVQGYAKNIMDESDELDFMEDTTDFNRQNAKTAHAV